MADRFPLILNTSNNQIQEIASGDNLDLTGTGISNAGIITAGNVTIGAATTDLIVTGDARITGILTIGTSSLTLDGTNNLVNVGTALTLGHTQGLQFHTQNLHSAGFEVNQINLSGIATFNEAKFLNNKKLNFGDDTDLRIYHFPAGSGTNYISAANNTGIVVSAQNVSLMNQNHSAYFFKGEAAGSIVYHNNTARVTTTSTGINVAGNVTAVDGTFSGNVSVGGTITYEDVTNIDSVGIITAREGVFIPDNKVLKVGNTAASSDLKIYHDTSDSVIHQDGTGDLRIRSDNSIEFNTNGTQNAIWCDAGAAVKLYYNNGLKLQTTSYGALVSGQLLANNGLKVNDGNHITLGDDNDLRLYFDGSNAAWNAQTGNSYFYGGGGNFYIRPVNAEQGVNIIASGAVELFYSGNKKLETKSSGVGVTGNLEVGSGQITCGTHGSTGIQIINDGTFGTLHSADLVLRTASAERARIDTSGNFSLSTANAMFKSLSTSSGDYVRLYAGAGTGKWDIYGNGADLRFTDNDSAGNVVFDRQVNANGGLGVIGRTTTGGLTVNDNGVSGVIFDVRTDDQAPWMFHFGNDNYHGDGGLWAYQSNGGDFEIRARGNSEFIDLNFNRWDGSSNQNLLKIAAAGSVELKYQGNKKLETTVDGITVTGSVTSSAYGSLGNYSGLFGKIRIGADVYGNTIKTAGDANFNITANNSVAFNLGANTNGSDSGTLIALFHTGGLRPATNNSVDLGTSSHRWRNIYTNDLQLSNKGKANDVDGTWGDYTIQEGESELFLINNRSGKKYKFNLTEVS